MENAEKERDGKGKQRKQKPGNQAYVYKHTYRKHV